LFKAIGVCLLEYVQHSILTPGSENLINSAYRIVKGQRRETHIKNPTERMHNRTSPVRLLQLKHPVPHTRSSGLAPKPVRGLSSRLHRLGASVKTVSKTVPMATQKGRLSGCFGPIRLAPRKGFEPVYLSSDSGLLSSRNERSKLVPQSACVLDYPRSHGSCGLGGVCLVRTMMMSRDWLVKY
jgi:hypothetical protein